jgi:hypothetical protein
MPVNSCDLELPGMERPWFHQNINNQLCQVQKQLQEGETNRLRTQLHLTQVAFHVQYITGRQGRKLRKERSSSILS